MIRDTIAVKMHSIGGSGVVASLVGTFMEQTGAINMANISYTISIIVGIIYGTYLIKKMIREERRYKDIEKRRSNQY